MIIIKRKKFIYLIMLIFIFTIIISFDNTDVTATSDPGPSINTILNGTNTTPDGIKDLNNWFTMATLASHTNNSEILPPQTGINKTDQAIVKITQQGQQNQFGAVWSRRDQTNPDDQNYIDVTKHQTMSMWLFFGGVSSANKTAGGDGMAFVLQNAPEGTNAFNNDSATGSGYGLPSGGQTLGVWGPVLDESSASLQAADNTAERIAKRAIKNSWAIEFDTYYNDKNSDTSKNSNFDVDVNNGVNHIASNFPASPKTYNVTASDVLKYGPRMNHAGLIENSGGKRNFLSDGEWHHLTITWLPAGTASGDSGQTYPEVTYNYDDKNIDGSAKTNGASKTMPITETDANGNKIDPFNLGTNKKLYWGFTGSTGLETENNLVIFESIPSIAEGSVSSTINDLSQDNREITTADSNYDTVNNGDNLAINYNLKYESGSQPWSNIVADIDFPTDMTYKNAVITYGDAAKTTENISLTGSQTNLTHTLTKALDKTNIPNAKVTVYGTAAAPTSAETTQVAAAHASFNGGDLFKDVMTTPFNIRQPKTISLKKNVADDVIKQVNIGGSTTLGGLVTYSDTIDPTKFQVYESINGNDPIITTMNTIQGSSNNEFEFPLAAKDLKEGSNTVKLKVEDQYHNSSNYIEYTVDVMGALLLKTSNASHFKTVADYPSHRIIPRANDWDIEVIDNRGANSAWTLDAEASALTNNGNSSEKWNNGGIIYVDKNGNQKSLDDEPIDIADGSKTTVAPKTYDIDSNWSTNKGILLKQSSYEISGTYSGTVTWTITDSPK